MSAVYMTIHNGCVTSIATGASNVISAKSPVPVKLTVFVATNVPGDDTPPA